MKVFKNKLSDQYEAIDVVYVRSEVAPHPEYFFECTEQELTWALENDTVVETEKNTFVKI